ncbi:hypothetical protein CASFOL_041709 [Castilleja foliolosa]|uniref:DUF4219 domain-containing protein n=1 Tax=Castilleja foliolosa TaxID=1961234 RepID=A0ABD3B8E2_9LAMI
MFALTPNQIPIFDGEHYDYWSSQMQTLYISLDLWDMLESSYEEPPKEGTTEAWSEEKQKLYKENVRKDASALRYLQQGVSKTIFPRIFGAKKAREAWDILKEGFKGDEKVISLKSQSLWRDFDNMAMKEGEGMQSFLSRVAEIVNQIRSLGDVVEDKRIVQKFLRNLPTRFNYIVAAEVILFVRVI